MAGIQVPSVYRAEEVLGSDVTTATLRAVDARDGQQVALRVPRVADEMVYERLRREAVIAASVEHRYIARLLRYDDDGRPCLALEALAGTLAPGERSLAEIVAIVGKIGQALDYLHSEGVMHVSLAPSDVALAPDGSSRLLNMGCAYLEASSDEFYWLQASAETIAPELLCGRQPTPASDVYSLGLLVYSLLAGQNPFEAYSPQERLRIKVAEPVPSLWERAPNVGRRVSEVVARAMDEAPSRRYRSAGAFARALARSAR